VLVHEVADFTPEALDLLPHRLPTEKLIVEADRLHLSTWMLLRPK